jgi:hypothetical protein
VTERQIRDAEVTGLTVPVFGASLRSTYAHIKSIENDLDYENPVYPYKRYSERQWASLNSTVHFGRTGHVAEDDAQFACSFHAARHELVRDPVLLADYRTRWINEAEGALRERRFTSSVVAGTAGTVPGKFAPSVQRFLVGLPKSLEVLREKAVEALGADAVLRLHVLLPPRWRRSRSSMVNPLQLSLKDVCGVKLSIDQANELYKFLDPLETTEAHRADLIAALLSRPLDGERHACVQNAWQVLLDLSRNEPTLAAARRCFDPKAHVDIRKNPPFIKDVLGRADPPAATEALLWGLKTVAAQRRRGHEFEQPGVAAMHASSPEEIAAVRAAVASALGASARADASVADEATHLDYAEFEDFCTFLNAGITEDSDFCRMLGVGFRIGAPVLPPGGGGAEPRAGATTRRSPSPNRAGSPSRKRAEALRTTYSDFGSGLAFATVPYRPGEGAVRAASPNRRQSRAQAGSADGDLAAVSALPSLVVLVTHDNGTKKLHRIPKDRFLDVHDEEGIRDRLVRQGVRGIVSVSTEF